MNGKHHDLVSYYLLLISLTLILSASFLFGHINITQLFLFSVLWIIGTRYITPDLDTNSNPRKRLGLVGWIIDKLFHHRGMLHNPVFWAIVWVLGVHFTGWWFTGLIVPQYIHILMDWVSTGVKRIVPKWVQKGVKKVF